MRRWQMVDLAIGLAACAACARGKGDPAASDAGVVDAPIAIDAMPDAAIDARPDACVATQEVCDGVDNDCDGIVDEGFPVGQACSAGIGACSVAAAFACDGSGGYACPAVPNQPTPEICGDGIDQNCDGGDSACPTNDLPADAIDISAGGTFTVDLSAAHDDDHSACSAVGGRDVFYQLTLPAAEVIYLDTFGSTFDSVIHMSSGACTATVADVACAATACGQNAAQIAMQLAAGTYCVVLDQAANDDTATANGPGAGVLHVVRGGRTGTAIADASGSVTGNTVGHANQTSPEPSCEPDSTQPDDGYFFTTCPSVTQTVGASTCSGVGTDTIIYLRKGGAHTQSVACDDDGCQTSPTGPFTSEFTGATITGPNLDWLIVDGWGSGASGKGAYTLTWTIE